MMLTNATKNAQVENPDPAADVLGIIAVKVQDAPGKKYYFLRTHFNIARITSFEGDTGPYQQNSHAWLCSTVKKSG